jgi:hypothetical protein
VGIVVVGIAGDWIWDITRFGAAIGWYFGVSRMLNGLSVRGVRGLRFHR